MIGPACSAPQATPMCPPAGTTSLVRECEVGAAARAAALARDADPHTPSLLSCLASSGYFAMQCIGEREQRSESEEEAREVDGRARSPPFFLALRPQNAQAPLHRAHVFRRCHWRQRRAAGARFPAGQGKQKWGRGRGEARRQGVGSRARRAAPPRRRHARSTTQPRLHSLSSCQAHPTQALSLAPAFPPRPSPKPASSPSSACGPGAGRTSASPQTLPR